MSEPSRSPITGKPLRVPGQSLREERAKILGDYFEAPFLAAGVLLIFAAIEWVAKLQQIPRMPWVVTGFALVATAFAAWRFFRIRPRLRALRQGIEGERVVGQYLERLREQGYQVFHDVVGVNANIDHVLIGRAGVLTVETKTWSKPAKGEAKVICTGERLRVGGMDPDRDPIVHAKAQAAWLKQLLAESTGRTFEVWPVVLFPGWFVEQDSESRRHAWVLEPKALPTFLANEKARLSAEDVKLASFHLSRFIRSVERDRS